MKSAECSQCSRVGCARSRTSACAPRRGSLKPQTSNLALNLEPQSLSPLLDNKSRRLAPPSRRDVEQRSGGEPTQATVDVRTIRNVRRRVDHPVEDVHFAVCKARIGLARKRDALLDDVWLAQRGANCLFPFSLVYLPAETDPF